jgi:glycosyltransferase involved in cell wall biosynthesis
MVGHSCVLSWWESVRKEAAPPQWDRYRSVVTVGLRAADLVVAPTRAMLGRLERFYGPFSTTQVILNGREPDDYRPGEKQPMVLAAGRVWDEAKNIATLARTAPRVGCPVYVAGDARHPDGGERSLDGVRFLGRLSSAELAEWYRSAAIYALPARYEPFGLTALEAALSGCALVLGDIDTLRELWTGAALFVPPDDVEALARAINQFIDDPDKRLEYAARASDLAKRLSGRRMAAHYAAAYRRLAGFPSLSPTLAGAIQQR